jgi:hypothetical protein
VASWVPVVAYRDFYEVPHLLAARVGARLLPFESRFDEALDDYEPDYSGYELPSADLPEGSWEHLSHGLTRLTAVLSLATTAKVVTPSGPPRLRL